LHCLISSLLKRSLWIARPLFNLSFCDKLRYAIIYTNKRPSELVEKQDILWAYLENHFASIWKTVFIYWFILFTLQCLPAFLKQRLVSAGNI
jgi:hypothetical protein